MARNQRSNTAQASRDELSHSATIKVGIIAAASTLVAAGIGLGGAFMGAVISRDANDSTQLRQMKQSQYSSLVGEI